MFVDPYRWLAEGLYQKKRKEEKKTMSKEAQNISMQQNKNSTYKTYSLW